ncbi:MAG: nucleotide exchange factor GrpE [Lachnospiraceae bacterium]|nr:nucleotide exchange factor GrpE [Lachnospiraceae bacterium]
MAENKEMDVKQETENVETEHGAEHLEEAAGCEDTSAPENQECSGEEEEPCSGEIEESGEEDSEEEESEEESPEGQEEKKGFFKKKEKKSKQEEKIAELTDRVQRQMAEFDNFRKRTEKEKGQMFEVGAKSIIEKILPVVDNFERGLSAVPEEAKEDAFVQGMDKIYKQLMTELENLEVRPIEAVGTEFNPEFHNAVMQVESEEFESGFVAQELQRGYTYRESVVRHSMVAVVQ